MLKREISRTNVLIASAGGMIGSGWLFSPFISAQMAGGNALISWVIATLFMLCIALPLCELGTIFPVSGGMTNYPSFTHGQEVGFLFAWTSWLSYVVMTPIEIQAILQYASPWLPGLVVKDSTLILSKTGYITAISLMLAVVLLNSYGIKRLAEYNKIASIIKICVLCITIAALFTTASSFSHFDLHLTDKKDWVQIFTALSAGGVAFAFTGFQNGLMLAGEVQNPSRNIPIAILGAVLIGFVLYFLLQLSFLAAIPPSYLHHGWQHLSFPGENAPLVGLALLVGLGTIAILLMFDASFSPFGTTLVYTAATSRILYGMALNKHLPTPFLKLNKHRIPVVALYANFAVGILSFLPFPGWQKMVAFLSSCSILSYGIGPICLLAMRKLQPARHRPFKLRASLFFCYAAFYFCNLMLYWCGFDVLWKLDLALLLGYSLHALSQKRRLSMNQGLHWFSFYMIGMLLLSYLGPFGGIEILQFPFDILLILPFSLTVLYFSQRVLVDENIHHELTANLEFAEG